MCLILLLHCTYIDLPPSAPTNVTGTAQTTSVTLTWSQSLMDVVTNYTVIYTRTGGCPDPDSATWRTVSGSPYNITGLEENIIYEISIIANNRGGMSLRANYSTTTLSTGE